MTEPLDIAHEIIDSALYMVLATADETGRIGTGQGVYVSAVAEQVRDDQTGIEVFSRRSIAHGGAEWSAADVRDEIRLYRAVADQHWILAKDGRPDHRIPL